MHGVLSRISVVQAFDVHSVFDALEGVRERLNNEVNAWINVLLNITKVQHKN